MNEQTTNKLILNNLLKVSGKNTTFLLEISTYL